MATRTAGRIWRSLTLSTALAFGLAPLAPAQSVSLSDAAKQAWTSARAGERPENIFESLRTAAGDDQSAASLRESLTAVEANLAKREQARAEKIREVSEKFEAELAKDTAEGLSDAVKHAVEMFLLTPEQDRDDFKREDRIVNLVSRAAAAARDAEAKGNWFTANEIFFRLNGLMEEEGTFKPDARRMSQRLSLIRLYAPEQFWKLRNDERIKSGKSPLPPYNGLGESYKDRLDGIDARMVLVAMHAASRQQIDRVGLREIMLGGVDSLRVLMTTPDLARVFPSLENADARDQMLGFLSSWGARLKDPNSIVTSKTLTDFAEDLAATNRVTVKLPENALWHELGNGATSRLDDFSGIIWPDELARFDRMTQGDFKGVGIQIQLDDETQMIKVVTPLEGTPAQRAGIKAGDFIKKINGQSAIGISLNQAVDLITGPEDTKVNLTIERPIDSPGVDKPIVQDLEFPLVRTTIEVSSVKGWKRNGPHEADWEYFIDKDDQIGYIRLQQFTERTTTDLRRAIRAMQEQGGLRGLILDLRYNPGGLLTEAVSVANTFIDRGTIVSTEGVTPGEIKAAQPGAAMLRGVPLIVLINEGSASASEIVSGAIRHYADRGDLNALVLGKRSFGKGSVQNVWPLATNAKMKLTTQYYKLPDGHILHRRPGATTWGVEPHVRVEMLPEAESEALKLRMDADVLPIDASGKVVESKGPRPDPDKLLSDGLDLQLQTALVMLQARTLPVAEQAQLPVKEAPIRQ